MTPAIMQAANGAAKAVLTVVREADNPVNNARPNTYNTKIGWSSIETANKWLKS